MDEIEEKLMIAFPGVEVLIHPDPEGHMDEPGLGAADLLASGPHGESPALVVQGGPVVLGVQDGPGDDGLSPHPL
jgi:ferrous-iron efflux pump FieF